MWSQFLKRFLVHFATYGVAAAFLTVWPLLIFNSESHWYGLAIAFALLLLASYQAGLDLWGDFKKRYEQEVRQREQAQREASLWKRSLIERGTGFPSLMKAIEEHDKIKDDKATAFLRTKKHPSPKAAEVVKEEARRRREAEFKFRNTMAIIEYYESIAPFLVDLKAEIGTVEDEEHYREYDQEERLDPATNYLAKEEFRKLSSVERNQLALDRFLKRPNKPNWLIGRLYERYIGYLYEVQDYDVEFVGAYMGLEDLGRDLICKKGNECILIQCKYWSQFKTIYEKHIFQFFGTVFQYKDEHPALGVRAMFYTTTQLSEVARRFAKELHIELFENFKFDQSYPLIKCNISRADPTKIYHLPFDQQYDKIKIEKDRGEFYCRTVQEAENAGFRRAFRYKGNKPE